METNIVSVNEYEQLSANVIKQGDSYLTRVVSAESVNAFLMDEETEYYVTSCNTEIRLAKQGHFTPAIIITFTHEDDKGDSSYLEMIISNLLGTFISEWR